MVEREGTALLHKIFNADAVQSIRVYDDNVTYRVSVVDITRVVARLQNPHMALSRFFKENTFEYFQFSGSGQRPTPVVSVESVPDVVKTIVANARMSSHRIMQWAERLGCSTEAVLAFRKGAVECNTMHVIMRAFRRHTCIQQHNVDGYRIDMFMPDFNIAVECDEYGHKRYNQAKELERTTVITNKLGCHWVRYDPYSQDFNIGDVIADIQDIIDAS